MAGVPDSTFKLVYMFHFEHILNIVKSGVKQTKTHVG